MKRTAVHFVDSDIFGGCEQVVLELLLGLDQNSWQPVLFHFDRPGIAPLVEGLKKRGVHCEIVSPIVGRRLSHSLPRFVAQLKQFDAAIFHAHLNWPLGCVYALVAARLAGVSTVATSHLYSAINGARHAFVKLHLQRAVVQRYIAVSDEVRKRLEGDLQIPSSKVAVVRNGIPVDRFIARPKCGCRSALTAGLNAPVVLTPARLHPQKGHVTLLEAAALVPNAVFLLAGDGPERHSLEAMAHALGIADRVRFLGQRSDIPELLASSDVFVLPSLYEGLPLSVLEAMAAGKPVIATRIGGTDEAVIDGTTGILSNRTTRLSWRQPFGEFCRIATWPPDWDAQEMNASDSTSLLKLWFAASPASTTRF